MKLCDDEFQVAIKGGAFAGSTFEFQGISAKGGSHEIEALPSDLVAQGKGVSFEAKDVPLLVLVPNQKSTAILPNKPSRHPPSA